MVTTRRMAVLTDPTSPPSASFDTVVPHFAATARLHSNDSSFNSLAVLDIVVGISE